MKKALSLVLTLIMLIGIFAVPAHAAEIPEEAPPQTEEAAALPEEGKGPLSQYIFVNYSTAEIEAISAAIAATGEYWVGTLEGGEASYWISLRITDHPELANINVLKATAQKMVDTAKAMLEQQELDTAAISLIHFSGELALHVLAILVMDTLIEELWPEYDSYYEMFDLAEMNPDEERMSPFLINFTGSVIMGIL